MKSFGRLSVLFSFLILFSVAATAGTKTSRALKADPLWLEKQLSKIGFSRSFIAESMKHYEPDSFEKTLTLNLLGFLRPPGQHMNLVTSQSVAESKKFIKENDEAFDLATKTYKVPADVIAALLWIETRHGEDVGSFHTVSVYLHLLQANRGINRLALTKAALEKNKKEGTYKTRALRKLMAERTKKKALWAEEQLIALAGVRKMKHLNLKTLRGSYAGAFGLPQFIPSSYQSYAKSVDPATTPDLNDCSDAIISVAHYLSIHGWNNADEESQVNALMKYNNSRDYADSILAISKRVNTAEQPTGRQRTVSSSKEIE